jgi:hypothetical protein
VSEQGSPRDEVPRIKTGRGEWIRTTDPSVPNLNHTVIRSRQTAENRHQLTSGVADGGRSKPVVPFPVARSCKVNGRCKLGALADSTWRRIAGRFAFNGFGKAEVEHFDSAVRASLHVASFRSRWSIR